MLVSYRCDQDLILGGWDPMVQATEVLTKKGATAKNWFIHTPICCPSRAEILTGRYFHNVKSKDGSGCMHVNEDIVNNATLAKYTRAPALTRMGGNGRKMGGRLAKMGVMGWVGNGRNERRDGRKMGGMGGSGRSWYGNGWKMGRKWTGNGRGMGGKWAEAERKLRRMLYLKCHRRCLPL
eukprot:gene17876-biopygen33677